MEAVEQASDDDIDEDDEEDDDDDDQSFGSIDDLDGTISLPLSRSWLPYPILPRY